MKLFLKSILIYIFFGMFVINVNAECSYVERKDLLDQTRSVEAFFEPDLDNKKFVFKLYNLTPDIYVKLEVVSGGISREIHSYDMVDGFYSYVENNINDRIIFNLDFYSSNKNCYGDKLTSKRITKGIINKFFSESICKGVEDYNYCKPVINSNFLLSDSEVYEKIRDYKEGLKLLQEKNKVETNMFVDFIKDNWKYILVGTIFTIVVSSGICIFLKKKGELK